MSFPPLIERPVDFRLPTSITRQFEGSSTDIPCGCRCGYLVLVSSCQNNYLCFDPNHEGSRILLTSNCFECKNDNDSSGTCNFCLLRLGQTSENDDVVGAFDKDVDENDDSNIQDKSIQDLSESFFKEDQAAVEYLTMCEESYERQKELLAYNKTISNIKEQKPKFDHELLITPEKLTAQLQHIADSHFDYLNENLWDALSTRILVAFYLQSDKKISDKVIAFLIL